MLVIDKLKEGKDFTGTDFSIARFILNDPENAVHMSLAELSRTAFCSEASIIRLCKKVGCSGFPEFKLELAKEFNAYGNTVNIALDTPFNEDADPQEIIHTISAISCKAITDMEQTLDMGSVQKAADMMMKARRIYFFGQEQSLIIAHDLRYKLLRIGIEADCDSMQGFSNLYPHNMNENDVAFVISHYVQTYNVLRWIELLKKNHVPMILLTCVNDVPYLEEGDVSIVVPNAETNRNIGSFSGRTGMIYACDCIFSLIFAADYERNVRYLMNRIDEIEEVNRKISHNIK